jgi:hypothetical protein
MLPKFIWSTAESENFVRSSFKADALGKINLPKKVPTVLKWTTVTRPVNSYLMLPVFTNTVSYCLHHYIYNIKMRFSRHFCM